MRMLLVGLMLCAPAALAANDDDDRDDGPSASDAVDVGKDVVDHLNADHHGERGLLAHDERQLVVKGGMSWEEMKAVQDTAKQTGVAVTYEGANVPAAVLPHSERGGEAALRHTMLVGGEDLAAVRLSHYGAGLEVRGGVAAVEGAEFGARGAYAAERVAVGGGAAIGLAEDATRFGARAVLGGGAAAGLGAAALGSRRRRQ